jgi:tRNA-binding EMAP/Myf-like protein
VRQLATVRRIADIRPIPNADAIEVCQVDGWECVIAKKDNFKVGDLIVYIEIDSIVPEIPQFEFLRDRKFRVRTIKLRGQVSQGLVVPLSILPENKKYKENDDVTDILGIKKYDPQAEQERALLTQKADKNKNPIIKFLMKFKWFRKMYIKPKKGGYPAWIVKTDEERIQNKTRMFEIEKELGTEFIVTEKLDGQSATYYLEKHGRKYEFGVCSRNIHLTKPDNSSYWTIAKQLNIENVLKSLIGDYNTIVLQGEILGEGIQGNKYKVKGFDFYAFNLIYPDKKIDTIEMATLLQRYNIKHVPILVTGFKLRDTIADMVEFAKGNSTLLKIKREGVVIRNYKRDISFKVINPEFLLAEKDE